ncbi:hypothetical protein [Streptomyces sp. NPDC126514]|uniref:hypothetical protein n=1 Tax=Streptomyces sp. NPDC126514 TaxID=3155210 RepID=UPI00331C44C2
MRHCLGPLPRRAAVGVRTPAAAPGAAPTERTPAYPNALSRRSAVFEPNTPPRPGGDPRAVRLVSQRDAVWAGARFIAVDAQS